MKRSELRNIIKEEIKKVTNEDRDRLNDAQALNEWHNKPDSYSQGISKAIDQLQGLLDGEVRGGFMDDREFIQSKRNEIQQIINTLETFQSSLR